MNEDEGLVFDGAAQVHVSHGGISGRGYTLTRTEDVSYDESRQRPERLDNDNAPED